MLQKVNGVVIKTQDYKESNKIITIFSKELGKFTAIARGAKKTNSRMGAVAQPFIYGCFLVYVSKSLSTIQQGEIIHSFRPIREDIVKTSYAAYIAELTDKLLDTHIPSPFINHQFFLTLEWISEMESAEIPIMMYELKLYQYGGFAPVVDCCVSCGVKELVHMRFSVQEGGLLCARCAVLDRYSIGLSPAIVKLLPLFLKVGLERIGSITMKEENKQLLRKILNAYYDQYGGYYLKSRKFLSQLDKFKWDND